MAPVTPAGPHRSGGGNPLTDNATTCCRGAVTLPARRRDPRTEKDRDYVHGVRTPSSNGLRQHKPQRKSAVHRSDRARWTGLLAAGSTTPPEEVEQRGLATARWREDINLAVPLATHAADTAAHRLVARVDAYSRSGPYDPARHRAPLIESLEKLTRPRKRRGAVGAGLAVNELLPHPIRPFGGSGGRLRDDEADLARRREWFADFLDAEPEWGRRLASWVELEHRAIVLGA
jgi:hypothetical protein